MHEYSPKDALDLLLDNIAISSSQLFERMKAVIDAGKDIEIEEPRSGSRKKKPHIYRKNVPYTDEEALQVALTVLESHLIDSRKIISATISEFADTAVAPPKPPEKGGSDGLDLFQRRTSNRDEVKGIVIESEPETVQDRRNLPDFVLEPVNLQELQGLEVLVARLKELTFFPQS
jgi:hypothetical protein